MKRYVKRQYGGNMVKHCGAFIQYRSNCNDAHKHNYVCGAIQNGSFNAEFPPQFYHFIIPVLEETIQILKYKCHELCKSAFIICNQSILTFYVCENTMTWKNHILPRYYQNIRFEAKKLLDEQSL